MSEDKIITTEYPKLELGGQSYEVKFDRGTMYTLDSLGVSFQPTFEPNAKQWKGKYSNLIDVLKIVIGFKGTPQELSVLCYDRRDEIMMVLLDAWGKVVLPSLNARVAALSAAQPIAETEPTKPTIQ